MATTDEEHTHKANLLKAVSEINARLDRLFQEDPAAAIGAARALFGGSELDDRNRASIAAGVLVDAGQVLKDRPAVEQGTVLFRQLHKTLPPSAGLDYNLANGLNALAALTTEPPWSPTLCALRREARHLYHRAASTTADVGQRSQALTNQANLLKMSFRRLEAYDAYVAALHADPRNGVASSGVARLLLELVDMRLGPKSLRRLAARYLAEAAASEAEIVKYAGHHALKNIRTLAERATETPVEKQERPRGYAGFVWEHRLALSLSMELFDPAQRFCDTLNLGSVSEPIEKGPEIPPVFGMWNSLKADYAAARWLAYTASQELRETGRYHDTLDYANYGVNQSLAVLAQRAAVDVLDKVAAFVTQYLELPGDPKHVYFNNRWHTKSKDESAPLEWQPDIVKELESGNPGVLALADLASDLAAGGSLSSRRLLRHSGTHRFVILHDMLAHATRESAFIEHYEQSAFESTTIQTLQMCRAALTYVRELVVWRERRLAADGKPRGVLLVPSHHYIRGR